MVGTDLGPSATPLSSVPLSKPTILVLGNEGHGMRALVRNKCTHLVKIMSGNSENMAHHSSVSSTSASDSESSQAVEIGNTNVDASSVDGDGDGEARGMSASGDDDFEGGVDSLNVSVTGGIILHHMLASRAAK